MTMHYLQLRKSVLNLNKIIAIFLNIYISFNNNFGSLNNQH